MLRASRAMRLQQSASPGSRSHVLSFRRRALLSCEHAAPCFAASWAFVRCSGADVVLSHRPQSTVPVPSAPMVGLGPIWGRWGRAASAWVSATLGI